MPDHARKNEKVMLTLTPAAKADLATIAAQDADLGEPPNLSRAARTAFRECLEARESQTQKNRRKSLVGG